MRKLLVAVLAVVLVLGCIGGPTPEVTPTPTYPPVTQPSVTPTTLKPDIQNFREAVSGNDANACDKIEDQRLKDICVRDIAVKDNKVDLCATIQTETLKDTCYYRIAVNQKDKNLCSKITNDFIKERCNSNT
jgi:capsular polysaccharide biosynthesis protein